MTPQTPEARARIHIDAMLVASGWVVQDRDEMNLHAGRGVAVREFPLTTGAADYLLFVDQRPSGVLEAKPAGHTLTGVEGQAQKYAVGLPPHLSPAVSPLPFLYQSTGVETRFTNLLDPEPKARRIFAVHRPETLALWLVSETLDSWVKSLASEGGVYTAADDTRPSSFAARLSTLPELDAPRLFPNQREAVTNLEHSLKAGRRRALIQMATGSGKTIMAITAVYRLIKFGGAQRVLFLVDRADLGKQAETEFESFVTPDDHRKFTELYNVQRLTSSTIGASSKVMISTVQRLYAMLRGEELDPDAEETSDFGRADPLMKELLPVVYNPAIPPELFDVVVIDECHRSIYSLWRQVIEYFDASLVGLTATPAKHTFGFFDGNLVMEYPHARAVADGVNVDFEVYQIRTRLTAQGATVEAGPGVQLGKRNRRTGRLRWEQLEDDFTWAPEALDRDVVAPDQIRTVIRTFRDKLFTEIFPGRTTVPKTLIFAKDDDHAERIVEIVRDEFGRGNDFCKKITYKVTGQKPEELIKEFRNEFNPRIAVTVDMIATGTDIRPIEIVLFLRTVKSRVLFEQMKGRGVRIVDPNELRGVTPDALAKTHFVIVDCVGVLDAPLMDTEPLEKKKGVSIASLLEHVAMGGTDADHLSSLASRLARLDKEATPAQRERLQAVADGATLAGLARRLVEALDDDRIVAAARSAAGLGHDVEPTEAQMDAAARALALEAARPLAANPALRAAIAGLRAELEQVIDAVSRDEVTFAGASPEALEKARALTTSFEQFVRDHADDIAALRFLYSRPYRERLTHAQLKALADAIQAPPRSWTPERLWNAYALLDRDRVRGRSSTKLLADLYSLVRFALQKDDALLPNSARVHERFDVWLAQQSNGGRRFSADQLRWLEMMRDHIATSVVVELEDLEYTPFVEAGGLGAATKVFGPELRRMVEELNEVLAA